MCQDLKIKYTPQLDLNLTFQKPQDLHEDTMAQSSRFLVFDPTPAVAAWFAYVKKPW